jgi:acetolactate decarboxylase
MTGTDLSVKVALDTLIQQPGLYAVGPVEDLQGEITVFNSEIIVSTASGNQMTTNKVSAVSAPFLAYAHVEEWQVVEVACNLTSLKQLEALIDSLASATSIHPDSAFPFLMRATWDKLQYHVIMRDRNEAAHSHEAHKKAKVHFSETEAAGYFVGFFSRHHEGVFTHKGQYIHVHFLNHSQTATGHLDALEHIGTIEVYLPVYTN